MYTLTRLQNLGLEGYVQVTPSLTAQGLKRKKIPHGASEFERLNRGWTTR